MKEKELREVSICDICKCKIGECGSFIFYRLNIKQYSIDFVKVQRQQGLGLMLGAQLAQIMGTDEDIAFCENEKTITICNSCMFMLNEHLKI